MASGAVERRGCGLAALSRPAAPRPQRADAERDRSAPNGGDCEQAKDDGEEYHVRSALPELARRMGPVESCNVASLVPVFTCLG